MKKSHSTTLLALAMLPAAAAFAPAPRVHRVVAGAALNRRGSEPQNAIVLPELSQISPAQLIVPIFFIGPSVQLGYAVEVTMKRKLGLPLEDGFFYKIVKSDAVQKGPPMKRMKQEAPKVGRKKLSPDAAAIAASFRTQYPQKDLEQLWGALVKVYGTPERAVEAIEANPQILNPSYSFCNTILESKKVLRSVMDEQEALEVMRLNPAVLQCGPSLEVLGAGEIRSIAMFRSMGNKVLPPPVRTAAVGILIASIAVAVVGSQSDDPHAAQLATTIKPILGGGLASVLAFVLYGSANAQRSVRDAVAKQDARRERAVWDK